MRLKTINLLTNQTTYFNSWIVFVVSYNGLVVEWTKQEIQTLDRNNPNIDALHQVSNGIRLYTP